MPSKHLVILLLSLSTLLTFSACSSTSSMSSQDNPMANMVAKMEVKEPIEGVCDNNNVIAILPFPGNGQVKATAPKTKEELNQELNSAVTFLKDKPTYKDKGMVNLIVNCKGEMVKCVIDNETKSPVLDQQIVAIFATMKQWTAGSLHKKSVDTVVLYSFTIENGKITLK